MRARWQAGSLPNNAPVIGLPYNRRHHEGSHPKAYPEEEEWLSVHREDVMNRSALTAALLTVIGCQEQSLPVAPAGLVPLLQTGAPTVRTNTWTPLNYSFFSNCMGEFLVVTGRLHVETTVWNDSDRLRIQSHVNMNLAASGVTSGPRYRVHQIANQQYEKTWNSGMTETDQVFFFNLISATGESNSYLTMNGTWQFAPNGTVTIEPKKWESVCR
jgi:hypothetical protein